jgi:hypothetical protein
LFFKKGNMSLEQTGPDIGHLQKGVDIHRDVEKIKKGEVVSGRISEEIGSLTQCVYKDLMNFKMERAIPVSYFIKNIMATKERILSLKNEKEKAVVVFDKIGQNSELRENFENFVINLLKKETEEIKTELKNDEEYVFLKYGYRDIIKKGSEKDEDILCSINKESSEEEVNSMVQKLFDFEKEDNVNREYWAASFFDEQRIDEEEIKKLVSIEENLNNINFLLNSLEDIDKELEKSKEKGGDENNFDYSINFRTLQIVSDFLEKQKKNGVVLDKMYEQIKQEMEEKVIKEKQLQEQKFVIGMLKREELLKSWKLNSSGRATFKEAIDLLEEDLEEGDDFLTRFVEVLKDRERWVSQIENNDENITSETIMTMPFKEDYVNSLIKLSSDYISYSEGSSGLTSLYYFFKSFNKELLKIKREVEREKEKK